MCKAPAEVLDRAEASQRPEAPGLQAVCGQTVLVTGGTSPAGLNT